MCARDCNGSAASAGASGPNLHARSLNHLDDRLRLSDTRNSTRLQLAPGCTSTMRQHVIKSVDVTCIVAWHIGLPPQIIQAN